jgi:hypothetical protein
MYTCVHGPLVEGRGKKKVQVTFRASRGTGISESNQLLELFAVHKAVASFPGSFGSRNLHVTAGRAGH